MQGDVRRIGRPAVLAMGLWLVMAAGAAGQTSRSNTVTSTFVVGSQAKLTISSTSLTFANADPDTVAQVPASEGPLAVTVASRSTPGSAIVLTVQASDDLRSGVATIAVSALTWTAGGAGFLDGTMSTSGADGRVMDHDRQRHGPADVQFPQRVGVPGGQLQHDHHLHADRPMKAVDSVQRRVKISGGVTAMNLVRLSVWTALALVALASPSAAQNLTFTVTPPAFTYPSGDPDSSPVVSSPHAAHRLQDHGRAAQHLEHHDPGAERSAVGAVVDPGGQRRPGRRHRPPS